MINVDDADRDGNLDFFEFISAPRMAKAREAAGSEEVLYNKFLAIDLNHNGVITASELRRYQTRQ